MMPASFGMDVRRECVEKELVRLRSSCLEVLCSPNISFGSTILEGGDVSWSC